LTSDYDELIKKWASHHHLRWELIKAQVWQESDFNPKAVSPVGAKGLMQLMPGTLRGLDPNADPFDPDQNIKNGTLYDRIMFDRLWEIPDYDERLKFMLAAYNGGMGYINVAMELAYAEEFGEVMPKGHKDSRPGRWQTWEFTSAFLSKSGCQVRGRRPDHKQITDYVKRIFQKYEKLEGGEA
jgi:hypothetical protein